MFGKRRILSNEMTKSNAPKFDNALKFQDAVLLEDKRHVQKQ